MRRLTVCSLLAVSSLSHAASTDLHLGPNLTTGAVASPSSLFSTGRNPALASFSLGAKESFRLNYFPAFSMGVEVGDVGNFMAELDELIDVLGAPAGNQDSAQQTLDRFNELLVSMGENGYVKVQNRISAPFTPLYWQAPLLPGVMFLELEMNTAVRMGVLDDPLMLDENMNPVTASSAYIKSGIEKRVSLGYSQSLFAEQALKDLGGQLQAGVKLSLLNLDLSKQVMKLQHLDGKDIDQVIRDEYKENLQSDTNMSLDVGLVWSAAHYRLGFSIADINSPAFEYGAVGVDCERYGEQSVSRNNCEAAAYFAFEKGVINAHETHVKHAVSTVDAAWFITPRWSLGAALDLASTDDLVGSENQWLQAATAFDASSFWMPDMRLGYRKNLEGSQLSTVMAGLTLFDSLTLDLEVALDSTKVDESETPRKLAFALSFSEQF